MTDGVAIPLHLAVHVLGVAVAAGLAAIGWTRREDVGVTWRGLVLGGVLVALSHVLSGALLVDDATLPLVLRAAGYAGIALGAAGTLQGSTAVVLVAPLPVHLAAGVAGLAAAVAATRGRLRDAGPVVLLGVGLAAWAGADAVGRLLPTVGATVSVLGSVAVGTWAVGRVGSSLVARALAGATALVVLTVIALSSAGGLVFASDLERDQLASLDALAQAQGRSLAVDDPADLRGLASALGGTALAQQLAELGGGSLDPRAQSLAELPGVDVALLVDAEGRAVGSWDVLATVVGPLAPVDETTLSASTPVADALAGTAGAATVRTGDGRVLAVGVSPVAPLDDDGTRRLDRTAGALLLGRSVTAPSTLARVSEQTAADVLVVVGEQVVAATDGDLVGDAADGGALDALAGTLPDTVELGGEPRFVAAAPLGEGATLLFVREATVAGDLQGSATRTLYLAGLLGLLLAAAVAGVAARRLLAPVLQLTDAAERIADGGAATGLPEGGEDEVGRLAAAFGVMVGAVATREQELEQAADVEAELRQRLEIVTSSLSEGLVTVDEHGVVTRANPAARTLLGIEDPVGRPVTRVLVGRDDTGRSLVGALAASGGRVVKAVVGPADTEVAATSAPLLDPRGRALGRVHVLRDVTGEAQAERMKTEFLANVSHELRTPLTPVRGYADVLGRRELSQDRIVDIAGRITGAATRLERVIDMLVDFAALEAGRLELKTQPTSVAATVEQALAELDEEAVEERVVVHVDDELTPVEVDPGQFRRQVFELVLNGLKFSDGKVTVSARRAPRRTVEVSVRDRGPGIPPERLAELSAGFRQGDGSATRSQGGLGLGLGLVRRIADAHGGSVRIEQPEDGGTEVVLVLRAAAP